MKKVFCMLIAVLLFLLPGRFAAASAEEILPEDYALALQMWQEAAVAMEESSAEAQAYQEEATFEAQPEPEWAAVAEPAEEPVPEEEPESETEPDPEPDVTSETEPSQELQPEPEYDPQPEQQPESETQPQPEAVSEPTFTLHTPQDLSIVFGQEHQLIGYASVSDVSGFQPWQRIVLYIDGVAFVNLENPAETIPLSITDSSWNSVICLWDGYTGAHTAELYIHVSADAWARAALGTYAATISYRAEVE